MEQTGFSQRSGPKNTERSIKHRTREGLNMKVAQECTEYSKFSEYKNNLGECGAGLYMW